MTYPVLARRDTALDDAETVALLRDRLGAVVVSETTEFGELTVEVTAAGWHAAVAACRDEHLLAFDLFDCLFGVDAGEDGFDVVAVLYSTSRGRRIMLRARCDGGRAEPALDSITDLYDGANWMERETFDMFGIDFPDHPGLLPRILCVENFEGWPLRKEFPLASRVAKPWPGVKEPAETDEQGNVIVREPAIGEAAGPSGLDEIIAKQAREANADLDADASDAGTDAAAAGGSATADEPQREEVQLDQETYDRLIAEGKSERIARSKAKAAFIKQQRAAAAAESAAGASDAAGDGSDHAAESPDGVDQADGTPDVADDTPAPEAPGGEVGAGGEGRSADAAAPPTGSGDVADEGQGMSDSGADADAAAAASATADATRDAQVAAREARAADQAEAAATVDADVEPIPAGSPPPDQEPVGESAAEEDRNDPGDAGADDEADAGASDADADAPAPGASEDVTGATGDDAGVEDEPDGQAPVDQDQTAVEDGASDAPRPEEARTADPETDGSDLPDGPYGPGSAPARADGSGPEGFAVKATSDGKVFFTTDSEQYAGTRADVWFTDVEAAEAAGFEHWDPYLRTDLDPDESSDEASADPPPVGGSLSVPDPADGPTTVDIDAADGPGVPGFGALDAHDRDPGGVPDEQAQTDDADDADAEGDADESASAAEAEDDDEGEDA